MIEPTVGQILHFYSDKDARPQAAIVVKTWGHKLVNLTVFDDMGEMRRVTSVQILAPRDRKPGGCFAMEAPTPKVVWPAAPTEKPPTEAELEKGTPLIEPPPVGEDGPLLAGAHPYTLAPHQMRVVSEREELDGRAAKLKEFLGTAMFESLPPAEQVRLRHQHSVMRLYSDILSDRIAAFTKE